MPEENENNTNNNTVTQEEYDQLKAELEAERAKVNQSVDAATAPLNERIASLETDIQARDQELAELKSRTEQDADTFASLTAQHQGAVSAYRELVLKSNPLLPADMVQGGTIDEVNASLEKAAALVSQVQQGIEAQQQTDTRETNIPAGAPGRTPVDLSSMSTKEKINYGLNQARKSG
jgi:prefoldin subunit 5